MEVLNDKVLVLNKNFYALCTVSVKSAIRLIFSNKAVIMDENFMGFTAEEWRNRAENDQEWFNKALSIGKPLIRTPRQSFLVPEVIRLTDFDQIINRPVNLTRQNIFIRDNFTCQYCGRREKLTVDHIIPKSRAKDFQMTTKQINSWENVTTCCEKCNNKKDNKTPKEANITLSTEPHRPKYTILGFERKILKDAWKPYIKGRVETE